MTADRSDLDAVTGDAYLSSVLQLLWPPPARIGAARRRVIRTPAVPADYVVLPSAARPKLLVPSRPRRVAAGALRNFTTASSNRKQHTLDILALGLRAGLHDWLPDRLTVTPGTSSAGVITPSGIDSYLREVLGRPIHVSLYIGPARAVRKPVLQVLDDLGATIAFAKLGLDEFTTSLVRVEAAAVARIAAAGTTTLRVPEVLHEGTWNGQALLVQSALPRGIGASASSPVLAAALRELAHVDGVRADALADSGYWARLTGRVRSLVPGPMADRLARAVDEIAEVHAETRLDFGASHGDFAPWNITLLQSRALVWDWEKFELDVPVGFDAVHCEIQGHVVFGDATPAEAFAASRAGAPSLLAPIGNAAAARLVVWLYAVDIATRYLLDREQEAGATRMTDLASWLSAVLDNAAAAPDPA